jgi:hypothetical protein
MNADDLAALIETEAEVATGRASGGPSARRVPWLCALARRLDERVTQLEGAGIPAVVAAMDRKLEARDALLREHAEKVRELEALKLPSPDEMFRPERVHKEKNSSNESHKDTVANGKSHDQTGVK